MEFWLLINWNTHMCAHCLRKHSPGGAMVWDVLPSAIYPAMGTSQVRVTAVGREAQTLF